MLFIPIFGDFSPTNKSHKKTAFGERSVLLRVWRPSVPISTAFALAFQVSKRTLFQQTSWINTNTPKMKLLLAAAALMAGVSAKPGTIRIDSAKGKFSSIVRHIVIRSFV